MHGFDRTKIAQLGPMNRQGMFLYRITDVRLEINLKKLVQNCDYPKSSCFVESYVHLEIQPQLEGVVPHQLPK